MKKMRNDRQQLLGTSITVHITKKEENHSFPLHEGHCADLAPHAPQHFRGSICRKVFSLEKMAKTPVLDLEGSSP